MRVAVAGGTGLVGRYVVLGLAQSGHEPVVLARSARVDLTTGAGLDEALAGVRAVVDVSNVPTLRARRSVAYFTAATGHLLAAGQRAGVAHHVALSIVGVDRVPSGYYAGKLAQERLVEAGPVPWSLLRATQFHEFAGQVLAQVPGPVAVVPRMRVRPVAAREVAAVLVALATGAPAGRTPELAGPLEHDLPELCRLLQRARGGRRPLLAVRLPGASARAVAGGALLPGPGARQGEVTFAQWLAEPAPRP